jgi:hypothetical protein
VFVKLNKVYSLCDSQFSYITSLCLIICLCVIIYSFRLSEATPVPIKLHNWHSTVDLMVKYYENKLIYNVIKVTDNKI